MKMTSLLWRHVARVHRTQSVSAVFCPFLQPAECYTPLRVTNIERVQQQCNLFKWQPKSTFYFSTCRPNLFKHARQSVTQYERLDLLWFVHQSSKQHTVQVFFMNNTFSSTSKLLTTNMYCWSCKTVLSPYTGRILEWMTFRRSRPFSHRKRIHVIRYAFNGNDYIFCLQMMPHIDVIAIKLTALTQN